MSTREEHREVVVRTCHYPPCGRQFDTVIFYAKYCCPSHKQLDYQRRKREKAHARDAERERSR
jgi:hypothetical protein